jgi:hypothetical protein
MLLRNGRSPGPALQRKSDTETDLRSMSVVAIIPEI